MRIAMVFMVIFSLFVSVGGLSAEYLECPSDADLVEGEQVCGPGYEDTFNCGCGCTGQPLFLNIPANPGQITICGESGTFIYDSLQYRDTDWYQLEVEEAGEITVCGIAEYPVLFLILEDGPAGDCSSFEILQDTSAAAFELVCMTQAVEPGIYWLWSGPSVFEGVLCGAQYIMTIDGYSATLVSADLNCLPSSGTVPFFTQMTVTLINLEPTRPVTQIAASININLGNGSYLSGWRQGWKNVLQGDTYRLQWGQTIPLSGAVLGTNIFTLIAEDVTSSPYNQPPYPPAGDTDTATCTMTGIAP